MKALALKYRPAIFDDVVEQGATIDILKNQINTASFKQAVLFVGAAGTGKTTCARIFANEINHGNGVPIELDAASNNGVDDVRELSKMAQIKSVDSEYRVFIIDECHMFSTGAWAALLKLIEEPPAKSVFILCTTDYWKIPKTILSRCQRFDFKKISADGIFNRLNNVINQEIQEGRKIHVTSDALTFIARKADGCMREALQMVDKCLSLSSDVDIDDVVNALGTVNYDTYVDLTLNIMNRSLDHVVQIIECIYSDGQDIKEFVRNYLEFLIDIFKYRLTDNISITKLPNNNVISSLDEFTTPKLEQLIKALLKLESDIKWSQNPKTVILAMFFTLHFEEKE